MLVHLTLSQRLLRLSSVLFILFTLFCYSEVISTILSSSSLIHSSASDILLLIPSAVFLISVIVLFVSVCLFFNSSAESLQSCLTLCDPIDGSPPGSPVPGIPQAITLEWVAIAFSASSSGTPIIQIVCLILSQGYLRLSSVLFILFTLFCSSEVIYNILSYSSLIYSSALDILLLIPSRLFLISIIVLSVYIYSFIFLGLC